MNDSRLYDELRSLAWRRKLTPAEESRLRSWLASHPQQAADWEAESLLNESLAQLPDVPVPGNFTAVVLERARIEAQSQARRARGFAHWWRGVSWSPRLGFAAVALAIALLSYKGVQEVQRRQLVKSVTAVSEVAILPSPEALRDFDAISVLASSPAPDQELLRLMQ